MALPLFTFANYIILDLKFRIQKCIKSSIDAREIIQVTLFLIKMQIKIVIQQKFATKLAKR